MEKRYVITSSKYRKGGRRAVDIKEAKGE